MSDARRKRYEVRDGGVFTREGSIRPTLNSVSGDGMLMATTLPLTLVLAAWVKRGDIEFLGDDVYF